MMKKWLAAICAATLCLLPLASCGGGEETPEEPKETVDLDYSDGYDYGTLDCKDGDFTFLQCDEDRWGMKTALAPEDMNGDEVNDAVFSRNKKIEVLYNVNVKCINRDIYETPEYIRTQCMGNVVTVDAGYVIGSGVATLMSEGLLNDLSLMSDMQLYEPWWGQQIREDSQFGGSSSLWYAQSDISLTAFELTWCVAVNLDMVSRLELEHPYTLVKEGDWTMDKMFEMIEQGMSPNTDGSYLYREDTSCVMGFVTYNNFTMAGLNGAGCFLTSKDDVGNPTFTGEGERFLDVVERWAKVFRTEGKADEAQEEGYHYEDVFGKQRAFAAGIEIKATSSFRSAGIHYGIVPVPKYEKTQQSYYSNVNYLAPLLIVPKTNTNGDMTGRILDTMSYLSYKELLPVYYTSNLALKALGTPEAVEMLDTIRDTRCFDTSLLYGWTSDFYNEVRTVFMGAAATTSPANAIGTYRSTILQTISDFISDLT